MLDTQSRLVASFRQDPTRGLIEAIDFPRLLIAARRQLPIIAVTSAIGLILGVIYISTATPQFTASADLLIDNRQLRAVQDVSVMAENGLSDPAAVESQVEILSSEKLALEVIQRMNLLDEPEFVDPEKSLKQIVVGAPVAFINWLVDSIYGSAPANPPSTVDSEFRKTRTAIGVMQANIGIARIPKTYVLTVSYTSPNPQRAADIANAIADAYLTDQLNSRYEATRRASVWLQERIAELRAQSSEADLAVQKYRAENNLVATDGKLVSEQQLSELSSQLINARAEMAQSEAKYKQIRSIIDSHQTEAAVTESLNSPVINHLRQQYFDASKREAEISSKLGPDHLQAVNFRQQMEEYERLIFEELGRIAATYQSSMEISRSREQSLTESLASLSGAANTTNTSLVKLRQLQQDADTYKALYQTFLQRYQEAVQQQSFPMNDARIITSASKPLSASQPKKGLALALSIILGAMVGGGIGAMRESHERAFRTGDQLREAIPNADFLGMLPALEGPAPKRRRRRLRRKVGAEPQDNAIQAVPQRYRYALDNPLSGFAETLRSIKVGADRDLRDRVPKVIGFVSVLPGEGKSTVSKNFATLLASQGSRVLLVDGDIRSAGLTRAVAPNSTAGLLEVVLDGRPISSVMLREPDSGLLFIPAVYARRFAYAGDILSALDFRMLRDGAGLPFDYIIVDLPPVGAVVDARAAANNLDAFVLVVEWGKTARRAIETTIMANPSIADKLIGILLNKVDMSKIRRYESYGSAEYYTKEYETYYRSKV